jgi:hypothetical protein
MALSTCASVVKSDADAGVNGICVNLDFNDIVGTEVLTARVDLVDPDIADLVDPDIADLIDLEDLVDLDAAKSLNLVFPVVL